MPEIKAELTALNLDTKGQASDCKNRLCLALAPPKLDSSGNQIHTFSPNMSSETKIDEDSLNSSGKSTKPHFSSSLPTPLDFLNKQSGSVKAKTSARIKRNYIGSSTGSRGFTTFGLVSYLRNLDTADERILDEELSFLNLTKEGSLKGKRKRIRVHLTDPTKSTSSSTCTANADIHSRLDILGKSNVVISDDIQAIKSDVTLVSACLPDGSSVKSPTPHSKPAGNDPVCIEKLSQSNQEINLTLEKP